MTVALYAENSPRLPVGLGEFHGYSGTLRRIEESGPLFDAYFIMQISIIKRIF